jgi:hypothetical protein
LYKNEYYNTEAREAVEFGTYFVKVDGANHIIKKKDGVINLYMRYDDKRGFYKKDSLPFNMLNLSEYTSSVHHSYYYKSCADTQGKLEKVYSRLTRIAEKAFNAHPDGEYSVEIVGSKFQRTPGVDSSAEIALHSDQNIEVDLDKRNFKGIDELLQMYCIEGFIIQYNKKYWKVRSNCYDKKCIFEMVKCGKVPVPENLLKPVLLS